jgi:hypothetical protein
VGIIGLVVCVYISGAVTKKDSSDKWGGNGISELWIAIGIVDCIQGIALFIILSGGAEVIRLLKKLNGLTYAGEISKPQEKTILKCSSCNASVQPDDTMCKFCGEDLE